MYEIYQSCRDSIKKNISLYCCSGNPDSEKRLYVFTDCILIWKAGWLGKKRDELVIDTKTDSMPFMFESHDCCMKTFWALNATRKMNSSWGLKHP